MIKFEKVRAYQDVDLPLPTRKTAESAGYDFVVAEDIVIPSYDAQYTSMYKTAIAFPSNAPRDLAETADLVKKANAKPVLVPTGMKCQLDSGKYLELSIRSSSPLKYWLVLANAEGIIDADYYNNPDNEGHIYFQLINFAPWPIQLHKGDIIGQGIIKSYGVTDDDAAEGERAGGFGSTTEE